MEEGDKSDPGTEYSSWPHDSDNVYLFANNARRGGGSDDTTILSEFGWNLRPENDDPNRIGGLDDDSSDFTRSFVFPDQNKDTTGSALQSSDPAVPSGSERKAGEATTSNNPSVSSTSSEDPPEKSTDSGGKPPEIP